MMNDLNERTIGLALNQADLAWANEFLFVFAGRWHEPGTTARLTLLTEQVQQPVKDRLIELVLSWTRRASPETGLWGDYDYMAFDDGDMSRAYGWAVGSAHDISWRDRLTHLTRKEAIRLLAFLEKERDQMRPRPHQSDTRLLRDAEIDLDLYGRDGGELVYLDPGGSKLYKTGNVYRVSSYDRPERIARAIVSFVAAYNDATLPTAWPLHLRSGETWRCPRSPVEQARECEEVVA